MNRLGTILAIIVLTRWGMARPGWLQVDRQPRSEFQDVVAFWSGQAASLTVEFFDRAFTPTERARVGTPRQAWKPRLSLSLYLHPTEVDPAHLRVYGVTITGPGYLHYQPHRDLEPERFTGLNSLIFKPVEGRRLQLSWKTRPRDVAGKHSVEWDLEVDTMVTQRTNL